jgi:hypothetical protein
VDPVDPDPDPEQRYKKNANILDWYYIHKIVSEYTKSIFACTENTLK